MDLRGPESGATSTVLQRESPKSFLLMSTGANVLERRTGCNEKCCDRAGTMTGRSMRDGGTESPILVVQAGQF